MKFGTLEQRGVSTFNTEILFGDGRGSSQGATRLDLVEVRRVLGAMEAEIETMESPGAHIFVEPTASIECVWVLVKVLKLLEQGKQVVSYYRFLRW